ncbi:hypothetical protein Lal_00003420 [Lupinus albus]|uniref:Putative transcription factor Hap3/NF-YB family n=1 Tax=Lupinus albus TaxID=3870 RepID=A0A6A4Q2B0_LUPAL|nr:putative transcription factor Hap3/NF-YB family [Lupinus albus]KAF1870214.1 hypothetical protein Lal_00003420 [Lupinus albus]
MIVAMAEEEENENSTRPELPTGRIKRIMRLDNEVNRVSGEALLLVTRSTELFLQFLADKSARVAIEKKRKIVKLEHLTIAVKRHQPTSDFLLDSLPRAEEKIVPPSNRTSKPDNPPPPSNRRIDQFFKKQVTEPDSDADVVAEPETEPEPEAELEAEAPVPIDEC